MMHMYFLDEICVEYKLIFLQLLFMNLYKVCECPTAETAALLIF